MLEKIKKYLQDIKKFIIAKQLVQIIPSLIIVIVILIILISNFCGGKKEITPIVEPTIKIIKKVINTPKVIIKEEPKIIVVDVPKPVIKVNLCDVYSKLNNKNFAIIKCWKNKYWHFIIKTKTNNLELIQNFWNSLKNKFKKTAVFGQFVGKVKMDFVYNNKWYFYKEEIAVK